MQVVVNASEFDGDFLVVFCFFTGSELALLIGVALFLLSDDLLDSSVLAFPFLSMVVELF